MTIAIANSGQTGPAAAATLSITTPTAGNILVCFIDQVGGGPSNTPTLTGWTINATPALYASSADTVWAAYKIASGSETSIAPTAGSSGTIDGICYWEISGAKNPIALDGSPVANSNLGAFTTGAINYTTSVAGSIVLMGVGSAASSGGQNAWLSSTSTIATNIGTAASRCFGGSYITTTTITTAQFEASWLNSHNFGMLGIALEANQGADMMAAFL